jgi:hypothetical protein
MLGVCHRPLQVMLGAIENPRCIGCKPKFLCRLCKGGHLTRLCPTTVVVQETQSLSDIPSGSESYLVSQHSNPSLADTMVMLMQSLADTTLLLGGDASLDHVVSHPIQLVVMSMQYLVETTPIFGGYVSLDLIVSHLIQPTVEEVVVSMQSLADPTLLLESDKSKEVTLLMQSSVNPTLLLGGDVSFDHVLSISSYVPSTQGRFPLSSSTLPPSPRMASFDWDDLIEPQLPSLQGSSASILSSSAWQVLGSPKLVSATCELLTFYISPAREPWTPP